MAKTILMYARTNGGKTAQLGQLAEHVYKTTGKKTRVATADKGGVDTIRPHINLGLVDAVEMGDSDPWIFLHSVCAGKVRKDGKWVDGDNANIGLFAFEGLRSFAEALMTDMSKKAAQNVNIGGGANVSFNVSGDGESLKIAGSNMAMFGIAQNRITEEVWNSFRLPADYICWTSSVSKDEDNTSTGKVLGPDVIGKALTAEVPRWFNYTFRLDVIPAQQGKPERHILYLGNHIDVGAGNAAGLGNIRLPLDAPKLESNQIEPASIVKALELIEAGGKRAEEEIKKRLAIK